MANMTTTANPLGRWWHPLPLMSGVGLMMGFIIMKLTGVMNYSWWFTIIFPILSDIIVNLVIVGCIAIGYWIAETREKSRRRKKK